MTFVHAQKRRKMLRLKAERLKRGWRLEDSAHFSKISAADISRIENGRLVPYDAYMDRLCSVFGLTPGELMQEVDA
jgi:transcriptional regulator with XRE-family HTH domain